MMYIIIVLLSIQILILSLFIKRSIIAREKMDEGKNTFPLSLNEIDVIIAAKETPEIVSKCIENLYECHLYNIILCLDGVTRKTYEVLIEKFPQVKILYNQNTQGKIKSQLKCLAESNNDNVLILDSDITLFKEELDGFVSYFRVSNADFLCPYSIGISPNKKSLLFRIAECDRYMRQRIVRAGRDTFGVSNLSGYCLLAKREKYIDIIDSNAIQDDVIATINLLEKGYSVKTYHKPVCSEIERSEFMPYLMQKTRWTAGNIKLIGSYPKLFNSVGITKALAFSSSFLLWYWSLWIDFIGMVLIPFFPFLTWPLLCEFSIKSVGLVKVGKPNIKVRDIVIYVIIWPFFSFACLLLSPYYLAGKIKETKTRR